MQDQLDTLAAATYTVHVLDGGIPIGNQLSGTKLCNPNPDHHCRLQAQYDALIQYFDRTPFKFWCNDPLKVDYPGESYKCTFYLMYYNANDKLTAIKITPSGRVFEMQYEHTVGDDGVPVPVPGTGRWIRII